MGSCTNSIGRTLVERLLAAALPGTNRHALDEEAADEIERLRAERDEAVSALQQAGTLKSFAPGLWDMAQRRERERIVSALGDMLRCPCCLSVDVCADDCTFAADCPAEAENLGFLRDAVRAPDTNTGD